LSLTQISWHFPEPITVETRQRWVRHCCVQMGRSDLPKFSLTRASCAEPSRLVSPFTRGIEPS
jgi:hypothetical protein